MNNLKHPYKVFLVNVAISFLVSIIVFLGLHLDKLQEFAFTFGVCCLISSPINFIAGIVSNVSRDPKWGSSFLISGAFLLLLSGVSCGSGAAMSY